MRYSEPSETHTCGSRLCVFLSFFLSSGFFTFLHIRGSRLRMLALYCWIYPLLVYMVFCYIINQLCLVSGFSMHSTNWTFQT